jgi:hypothetical protein
VQHSAHAAARRLLDEHGSAATMCSSAGTWKGLEVAMKTVVFEGLPNGSMTPPAAAASEVAIASDLVHGNLVATYAHRQRTLIGGDANELRVLKLYLIQARIPRWSSHDAGHWACFRQDVIQVHGCCLPAFNACTTCG